jgi:hypothetical protein
MKKLVLGVACILFTFVVLISVANSEEGFKEGKWTMTMVVKNKGFMPPVSAQTGNTEGFKYDIQNGRVSASVATPNGTMNMPLPANLQNNPDLSEVEMHGGGDSQGMTMTITKCITKEDAMPDNKLPSYCEETRRREGDTFYYHAVCDQPGNQMESTGEMTYAGDTMQGVMSTRNTINGMSIDNIVDVTGQYLGPCS